MSAILQSLALLAAQQLPTPAPHWVTSFGTGWHDQCRALLPDGAGGSFGAGSRTGPGANAWDGFVFRTDPSGQQLWRTAISSPLIDHVYDIAPDGTGGIFAVGLTYGSLGGPVGGHNDGFLAHLDGSGGVTWIRQSSSPKNDFHSRVVSDGTGGVFVSSREQVGAQQWTQDGLVARYDSSGTLLWQTRFSTPEADRVAGLAADGLGGVFVAGDTRGDLAGPGSFGVDADVFLAHVDGAGNVTWLRQFTSAAQETAGQLVLDVAGDLWVTGLSAGGVFPAAPPGNTQFVAHFDRTGQLLSGFTVHPDDDVWGVDLLVDDAGVFVGGNTSSPLGVPLVGQWDAFLSRYSRAGTLLWTDTFGGPNFDNVTALIADGAGGVVAAAYHDGAFGHPVTGEVDILLAPYPATCRGTASCPLGVVACPSSSLPRWEGAGMITATGSPFAVDAEARLDLRALTSNTVLVLLASRAVGPPNFVPGVQGALCLGSAVGRQGIATTDASGVVSMPLDLLGAATPQGPQPVAPGETWSFQAWSRGGPTGSAWTSALSIAFR